MILREIKTRRRFSATTAPIVARRPQPTVFISRLDQVAAVPRTLYLRLRGRGFNTYIRVLVYTHTRTHTHIPVHTIFSTRARVH